MYEVTITAGIHSAHQLRDYSGKCENLHGHNWTIEVSAEKEKLDSSGMVIDFHLLKERLNEIIRPFDHARIDRIPPFDHMNPTAENLARFIFDQLSGLPDIRGICRIKRVTVSEDMASQASYTP